MVSARARIIIVVALATLGSLTMSGCGATTPATTRTTPEASTLEAAPFLPVKSLPMTLQYEVDGVQHVAVQLSDAGIPGLDSDFKVTRLPESGSSWCMSGLYLGTYDAPHTVWRTDGCYIARRDGLWWFEACPTSAAAAVDPEKAGGVLQIESPLTKGNDDDEIAPGTFALGGQSIDVTCRRTEVSGMMKHVDVTTCASPLYGLVSVAGASEEMSQTECDDASRLVAVEPGPKDPLSCSLPPRVVGKYRFTTRMFRSANGKGINTTGRYTLAVSAADGCTLAAHLEKVGIDQKDFAPDAVQKGDAVLAVRVQDGALVFDLRAHVADAKGKGFDATYSFPLEADAFDGDWSYRDASGFSGLLQGARGDGPAVAFDLTRFSDGELCGASFDAPEYDNNDQRRVETPEYDACLDCDGAACAAKRPWMRP